jgi:hypothetical protein
MKCVNLAAAALLSATMSAHATLVIRDFQGVGFDFTYGSWIGNETIFPTYVQIAGTANETGGAGVGISPTIDLYSYVNANGQVQVDARLVPGNQADNFNIIFFSSPTDLAGYQISASLLNTTNFTTVSATLNNPTFTSGSINWSNVNQVQIQGDYTPDPSTTSFAMQFANLVVPEPSTALLTAIGIGILATLRRSAMFSSCN